MTKQKTEGVEITVNASFFCFLSMRISVFINKNAELASLFIKMAKNINKNTNFVLLFIFLVAFMN